MEKPEVNKPVKKASEMLLELQSQYKEMSEKLNKISLTTLTPQSNEVQLTAETPTHTHPADKTPLSTVPLTPKPHTSVKELIDCPTCRKEAKTELEPEIKKELEPIFFKQFTEELKAGNLVKCSNKECGNIVRKTEEKCPNCGCKDGKCF